MKLGALALACVILGLSGTAAQASPYSCTIVENDGQFTHTVQFDRQLLVTTDATDYIVRLTDYLGEVKVEFIDKTSGKVVASRESPSDVPVAGQAAAPFVGLNLAIPHVLSVSCETLSTPGRDDAGSM